MQRLSLNSAAIPSAPSRFPLSSPPPPSLTAKKIKKTTKDTKTPHVLQAHDVLQSHFEVRKRRIQIYF